MIHLFSLNPMQSRTLHSDVLCVSVEHICTPKWVYLCSSNQSSSLVLYTPLYCAFLLNTSALPSGCTCVVQISLVLCTPMHCAFLSSTAAFPSGCTLCVFQKLCEPIRAEYNCANKTKLFFFKTKSPILWGHIWGVWSAVWEHQPRRSLSGSPSLS